MYLGISVLSTARLVMLNRVTPKYLYKEKKKKKRGREGGGRDSWLHAPVSLVNLSTICQHLHRLRLDGQWL